MTFAQSIHTTKSSFYQSNFDNICVTIDTTDDLIPEDDEELIVTVSSSSPVQLVGDQEFVVTIVNDDERTYVVVQVHIYCSADTLKLH